MTKIKFTGATAIASNHEALTVGAVGLVVQFEFNSAWDGLNKIAVFHCGGVTKDVLGSSFPANICPIPWECLQEEGETLYCGVYGTDSNGKIIIPSKMARLGTVHPGADPTGDESLAPTAPMWIQVLSAVGTTVIEGEYDGMNIYLNKPTEYATAFTYIKALYEKGIRPTVRIKCGEQDGELVWEADFHWSKADYSSGAPSAFEFSNVEYDPTRHNIRVSTIVVDSYVSYYYDTLNALEV